MTAVKSTNFYLNFPLFVQKWNCRIEVIIEGSCDYFAKKFAMNCKNSEKGIGFDGDRIADGFKVGGR